MVREQLINDIKEYMNVIAHNNKDKVLVNREDLDYTIMYDVKDEFIVISLACEDLSDCNFMNWCDPEKYEDTSMFDLQYLDDFELNDLDVIKDLLSIINGDL